MIKVILVLNLIFLFQPAYSNSTAACFSLEEGFEDYCHSLKVENQCNLSDECEWKSTKVGSCVSYEMPYWDFCSNHKTENVCESLKYCFWHIEEN